MYRYLPKMLKYECYIFPFNGIMMKILVKFSGHQQFEANII